VQLPWLEEACAYMGKIDTETQLAAVFLLGHWNVWANYSGCPDGADVPQVRCAFFDRSLQSRMAIGSHPCSLEA
jgi:hypothetical protein